MSDLIPTSFTVNGGEPVIVELGPGTRLVLAGFIALGVLYIARRYG